MKAVSSRVKIPFDFLEYLIKIPSLFFKIQIFILSNMFCLEISSNSNTFSSCLFNKIPIKPFLTTDPTFHHLSSVEYYPISLDIWEDISLESSKSCYFSYLIYDLWDLVRSLTLLIFLPNWQGIEYRDHYMHFLWALFLPNQCISRKTLHFKIDQLKHNIWASLMAQGWKDLLAIQETWVQSLG